MNVRTDLAMEERELRLREGGVPDGVHFDTWQEEGITLSSVEIRSRSDAEVLRKPRGRYVTLELTREQIRTQAEICCAVLAKTLAALLGGGAALVVGLGNAGITPDAIGPRSARHVLATRHLQKQLPALFNDTFREVSVLSPGVLGATGMESAELVRSAVRAVRPDWVIAVDALAAGKPERLCRSIQVSDVGIVPGSGIRNDRAALDRQTLGVPVIAVGIPTVCDLHTLGEDCPGMIVTPSDIDLQVEDLAKIAAMGINRALHPKIDPQDLAEFVS